MTSLGFENYAEALKVYLTKYREVRRRRGPSAKSHSDLAGLWSRVSPACPG